MDTLKNKLVRIRKPQRCWGCGKQYGKGSKLKYLVQVDNGEFAYSYWCDTCEAFLDKYGDGDDMFFGDLKYDDTYKEFAKTHINKSIYENA